MGKQHRVPLLSERKRFPDLGSAEPAIDHFMEKPKKIGKIDPKAAVETARIEPSIHERIVPLNHHETFALETIHHASVRMMLSDPLHHQSEASCQKAPAENRRAE
jgi:hypothetical protein